MRQNPTLPHISFSIILGLCPLVNLIQVFNISRYRQQKKNILISSALYTLVCIVIQIVGNAINPTSGNTILQGNTNVGFIYIIILSYFITVAYSITYFTKQKDLKIAPLILESFGTIIGVFFFTRILIYACITLTWNYLKYIESKGKKKNFIFYTVVLIGHIMILVISIYPDLSNTENNLFLTRLILLLSLPLSLFSINTISLKKLEKAKEINKQQAIVEVKQVEPTIIRTQNKYQPELTDAYTPPEKNWTVDDTLNKKVELLTLEDIINPIPLKNENEKAVRNLIRYFRKLQKHTDAEIEYSLGEEGISSYLEKFYSKAQFEDVRIVFLRSLSLVIEDYAKRDARVVTYYAKLHSMIKRMEIEVKK